VSQFFSHEFAAKLAGQGCRADLILGNNVFAHVPDINDLVAGLARLLKPSGCIVLEFPYACDLVEHVEFDTIYHEHVFYFTLTALAPLFVRHGLDVIDVEHLRIHGGSLRLYAAHRGTHAVKESVTALLAEELVKGVTTAAYYDTFSERVRCIRDDLVKLLQELTTTGKVVAAYGASAKGSTLLNFCGLGRETLDFVADRSTYKQGRVTPGSHLPIIPAEELAKRQPDYTLLLTWNFAEEILEQQGAYRKRGGKFIIPLPKVTIT
jgi:SAM-dependent methyltransferase